MDTQDKLKFVNAISCWLARWALISLMRNPSITFHFGDGNKENKAEKILEREGGSLLCINVEQKARRRAEWLLSRVSRHRNKRKQESYSSGGEIKIFRKPVSSSPTSHCMIPLNNKNKLFSQSFPV